MYKRWIFMYKILYTIYTCVLLNLSYDLYIFPHTWGSRGTPFFHTWDFFCRRLYVQNGIGAQCTHTELSTLYWISTICWAKNCGLLWCASNPQCIAMIIHVCRIPPFVPPLFHDGSGAENGGAWWYYDNFVVMVGLNFCCSTYNKNVQEMNSLSNLM